MKKKNNPDDEIHDIPKQMSKEHHFQELQYDILEGNELGYVLNSKYIFPLDSNINEINP
jgi:hypothetical protein